MADAGEVGFLEEKVVMDVRANRAQAADSGRGDHACAGDDGD